MVGISSGSKQTSITLPIFIAITALARMAILQKEQDPIHIIYEVSTILLLAIAAFIVNARPSNLALRITKQGEKLVRPAGSSDPFGAGEDRTSRG